MTVRSTRVADAFTAMTEPNQIRLFQLLAVRAAIKLEAKGLRHSGGRSVKARWAFHYGLPIRAKRVLVLEKLEAEMRTLGWQGPTEGPPSP